MKDLLAFPVRNPQFMLVLVLMLIALGISSWFSIPRGEDPPLDFPRFTVVVAYPGAAPADLEIIVVQKIEEAMDELDDVETIRSAMADGVATVVVEFEADEDPAEAYDAVLRQIAALRPELPIGLARLEVIKSTTLDVAIAQLALVSTTAPYHELESLGEQLLDRLRTVSGVRTTELWGVPARQVDVILQINRLAQLGIPPSQVMAAIGSESLDIPAGAVESGGRRFTVRGSGSYESIDEVRRTVVRGGGGAVVRVGDVADVRWGYGRQTHRARLNGERAVFVTVTQQPDYRIAQVRDGIWEALDEFEKRLPADIALERPFDQATNVQNRLSRLQTDFAIAIAVVAITLLPLGLRAAGIVMVSIPLSLAMGVALLHLTGFTINQLSIVGAVIALGLLVDDSIVVVENIARFLRQGYTRTAAAVNATQQIAVAVTGATVTLVLSFVPLLVLPGSSGDYIRSLPIAVVFTVLASLFVSLTIIPFLASRVLSRSEPQDGNAALKLFEHAIQRTYAPVLERALQRPWTTLALCGAGVLATLVLIPTVGFSLFPKAETPQFHITITSPEGASIDATDEAARFGERILLGRPEVRAVFSSVGHDNPRTYYNVAPRRDDPRVGQLFVVLNEYDPDATPMLLDSLRVALAGYPGARLELKEFENGPLIEAPIALRVFGSDLDSLRSIAGRVEAALEATEGTQYVTNPLRLRRTDLRVAVDRDKAGLLGVTTAEIDRTLRMALEGLSAGELREADGESRPVVVRIAGETQPGPDVLDHLHVASLGGSLVPLRQLARWGFETAAPDIERLDRERAVTVTSYVRSDNNTDRVTREALARVDSISLPLGYRLEAAGEIESRRESFGGVSSAILLALFGILAILVLEFGSFRSMLIVASVIPLGAMGGFIALWLTNNTLSFTAAIGFVALLGIEIKTSILLVDYTNYLRREGAPLDEAIRRAGETRFLPIVLTSLTAVGGLLPLAIAGHALYAPLAWVVIGGLVSSTLLARIVTPVLYRMWPPALLMA